MNTRVLLVRHGATLLTSEDRFAGATDVALSPEGARMAERLSERLRGMSLSAVYASPMQRTVRTAQIACRPHALQVQLRDGLREMNHGHWEGRTRSEVEEVFREEYEAWEADPFTCAPAGGETGLDVLSRALPTLRGIVASHSGATVLVVSHKATIRLLIGSFLGFDLRGYRDRLDQHPCCLNVLDFKDAGRARLMLFNDISHYADQPRPKTQALSRWWDARPA